MCNLEWAARAPRDDSTGQGAAAAAFTLSHSHTSSKLFPSCAWNTSCASLSIARMLPTGCAATCNKQGACSVDVCPLPNAARGQAATLEHCGNQPRIRWLTWRAAAGARARSACALPAVGVAGWRAAATTAATMSKRSTNPRYWVRCSSANSGAATWVAEGRELGWLALQCKRPGWCPVQHGLHAQLARCNEGCLLPHSPARRRQSGAARRPRPRLP